MPTTLPFDNRDGFIWYDGKLVPWREATLHLLTHSLHYASSVFEGIRVYAEKPFKLTEHNQRLKNSAEILGYELPFSVSQINESCLEVIKTNGFKDCYLRPLAWRGSEVMGVSARKSRIHVAIAAWEWPSYFSLKSGAPGLTLKTATWRRPSPLTAPIASKAASLYAIGTLAKHAAEDAGFHDALMWTWEGNVAEATGANIFFRKDDKLHTPIPDSFLNGITRQTVMGLARARGIEVCERFIAPEEIASMDEIFLTGTAAEVTSVVQIDDHTFPSGQMTRLLQEDFFNLTKQST